MTDFFEVNFDGLVGPTHHYGGLASGNLASLKNRYLVSKPRQAALQGLAKMKLLSDLGFHQAVLPPQVRPNFSFLEQIGYSGDRQKILQQLFKHDQALLSNCCSASAMWVANTATISPSCDTIDGKLHITPANLHSHFHRALETNFTFHLFKRIFSNQKLFSVHTPLPSMSHFADEGAANHCRFASKHHLEGFELFVYGRTKKKEFHLKKNLEPRQTKEAFEAIMRNHQVKNYFFLQQNPKVIEKGVFHNDVISVSNENLFLYHEDSFAKKSEYDQFKKLVIEKVENIVFVEIKRTELSIEQAVNSYLFNSQILSQKNGLMILIAPIECKLNKNVKKLIENKILKNSPIQKVYYLNLRESMQNGGGPACLRLRMVMSHEQIKAIKGNLFLNSILYQDLQSWVKYYYPKTLTLKKLADYDFIKNCNEGLVALENILVLHNLYKPFLI